MKQAFIYSFCGLIGVAAGIGLYGWQQATYLPTGYQTIGKDLSQKTVRVDRLLGPKLTTDKNREAIVLNEADVSQMLVHGVTTQPDSEQLLKVAKGVNTSIQADRIEAGLVMDLSEIPSDLLPPEGQRVIVRLQQSLPILLNQEVYVGLTGRPHIQSGRLILGEDALVRIGRLQLPLADVLEQTGLSQTDIESYIVDYLERNNIRLEAIDLRDGEIVFELQP